MRLKNRIIMKWRGRESFWRCNLRKGMSAGLVLFLLSFPQGCMKEFPETFPTAYEWKPLFAFPVGEAEFGLTIPYGFDTLLLETDTLTGYPEWVSMEKIPLAGGIGFDFEQVLGNRDEINFAILRLNAYNGFPSEVEIQAYIEDGSGGVLDSLFHPKMIMERGQLSGGGSTKQEAHTQEEVYFDQERLDLLMEAKRITFRGELRNVMFFPQYSFRVQIGAVVGVVTEF